MTEMLEDSIDTLLYHLSLHSRRRHERMSSTSNEKRQVANDAESRQYNSFEFPLKGSINDAPHQRRIMWDNLECVMVVVPSNVPAYPEI